MEKLNKLIRPGCYHPQFKNGAALGAILGIATVGAVSGAGAAAGDALADSLFDTSGRDYAAGQNEQNRQWQSEEAQKNRDFQQQMQESNQNWYTNQWMMQNQQTNKQWYQQADYSNNLAYQSWLKQQQYNTPAAIASRLQAAGANPSAVLNAQTYGGTGLSAAPVSPNSPNVSLPSTPSGAMPSSAMSSVAQLPITSHSVSELAAAYKSFKEGSVEKEKANAIITNLLADTKNKETINRMNEIDLAIKNSGMSAKQQQSAMQPFLEVRKLIADIQVSKALGGVYNEDVALKKLQSIYQDAQNSMIAEKLARYPEILSNEILLAAEEIKTEKSKQSLNYASGSAQITTANSIKALNDSVIVLNQDRHVENLYDQLVKGIEGNNPNYSGTWNTSTEGGNSLVKARRAYASALERQISENTELTPEQIRQAKYATEQLRVASNYAEMNAALGALSGAVGMANATRMANAATLNAEAHSSAAGSYGRFCDSQIRRLSEGYNVRTRYVDKDGHVTGGWNQYHD